MIDYAKHAGSAETVGFGDGKPVTVTLHPDGTVTNSRPVLPVYNYAVHTLLWAPVLDDVFENMYDERKDEWDKIFAEYKSKLVAVDGDI